MLKSLRLKVVSTLIEINEKLFFEKRIKKFFQNKNTRTIIDVGANKGQTIDFFLNLNASCQIFAFEPNPDLFQKLKIKYGAKSNIKLFQLGASSESGEKVFHENVYDCTSSFQELNYESAYLKKKANVLGVTPKTIIKKSYPVKVVTLSSFIAEQGIEKIDVLKIDTEGHEFECLKGLIPCAVVERIQLEMHNDDMYINSHSFNDIEEFLKQYGYLLEVKVKHGFGDFDEVIFLKTANNV